MYLRAYDLASAVRASPRHAAAVLYETAPLSCPSSVFLSLFLSLFSPFRKSVGKRSTAVPSLSLAHVLDLLPGQQRQRGEVEEEGGAGRADHILQQRSRSIVREKQDE